ncbi:MAG: hypothetical protein GWP91_19345 [Rhodobacterales bacterium]|nr:hypothetical protein [Rhodobacterales bacterium]
MGHGHSRPASSAKSSSGERSSLSRQDFGSNAAQAGAIEGVGFAGDALNGLSGILDAAGLEGASAILGLVGGGAAVGKDVSDANPVSAAGNFSNAVSTVAGDEMSGVFGGLGSFLGAANALNNAGDMAEQGDAGGFALEAGDYSSNALMLGHAATAGAGATGVTTAQLGAMGVGEAFGAGALGSAGMVLGAGVAGVKVGQGINAAAGSEYAQGQGVGPSGHSTHSDYWLDVAADMNDGTTTGAILGGATALTMGTAATFVDATAAAGGWAGDAWSRLTD